MLWRRYKIFLPIIIFGIFYLIIHFAYLQKPDTLQRKKRTFIEVPEPRSEETLNPSGEYAAYIEPYEWEICGNIYVKNLKTSTTKKLTDYGTNRSSKQKQIVWFNDTLMLLIEGYTWGTVSVGGSLYFVNSRTGEYKLIMNPLQGQEIAEVTKHKNSIVLRIAIWTDDNYMKYDLHTQVLDADSVLRSLMRGE